jgi:hypothetical protein
MANEAHLAILKKGVEAWNRWRKENPGIAPDLNEANLSEVALVERTFGMRSLSDRTLKG